MCFHILPDALLDKLCKFRGFAVQTKHKNTRGIMRYQLRIFQLILIAFSTGYVRGISSYWDSEKKQLKQKPIKQIITIYKIFSVKITGIFLIIFC